MPEVQLRYFAKAKELAGCDSETMQLPSNTSTEAIASAIVNKHPAMQQLLGCSRIAVAQAFASGPVVLQDGDEVAVIPPVSGG